MSGAPARGTVPRRQRRHHHHHHHHHNHHHHLKRQKRVREETPRDSTLDESEEKRPKVNPIFLWASQREQRIIEVRCEDYDKRNRIKLTKTAQGWRSIPRTTSNVYTVACKKTSSLAESASPTPSVSSNDEKENGERHQEIATPNATANSLRRNLRRYTANGATNGLLTGDDAGKKRRYNKEPKDIRRGYSYPLGARDDSNWNSDGQACPSDGNNDNENERRKDGDKDSEQKSVEIRQSSLKIKIKLNGRSNLERLQKDKLFQPRVVLEQLHLSQFPESMHQNIIRRMRNKDAAVKETERIERDDERHEEEDAVDEPEENEEEEEEEVEEEEDEEDEEEDEEEEEEEEQESEKPTCRVNKAGIQDILNMIDATASPVLATDTPNADLPVDSTKTYEILDEKQFVEKNIVEERIDDAKDQLSESVCSYQTETVDRDGEIDDKLEVHEEKILEEDCLGDIQGDKNVDEQNKLMLLSMKNNSEMTLESCKVAEADGGFVNLPRNKSNSLVTFQTPLEVEDEVEEEEVEEEAEDEIEEEAQNEPVLKVDYKVDSSKILDALRNTPGLSVSVTRTHTPEHNKSQIVSPRPPSKASSSSRSPDSQAECVEKLLKNSNEFVDNRGRTNSPRSLPGLSIIIPSFRYKSTPGQMTTTSPTNAKRRVESPESTVSFHKADTYPEEIKLVKYPHEDDKMREEDEDDCDSQVLEDLRQKRADSPIYDSIDVEYYNKSTTGLGSGREDNKTSAENAKTDSLWTGRNSEAQAKCKYQHFDEQILEELRSRGTVVSPQPSGIPCSPASRRPSSTYLERLLPSPPCSVSCSEDTNELTLRSILASSGSVEPQDHEKSKEGAAIRSDPSIDPRAVYPSVERNARNPSSQRNFQDRLSVHNQEVRNPGRPMSSGDIHSTLYTMADRIAPKRPMSAEWQSTGRQRNQINYYQKVVGRTKHYHADNNHDQDQVTVAASSSTEKLLDPASQLRELVETVGHLIPDPLLVPRSYLPALAAAPAIEIPKLLVSRPELRLPEALNRPELLQDPDLLVISLAHLQHVLDHGEGPVSRSHVPVQQQPRAVVVNGNKGLSGHANNNVRYGTTVANGRPKLSCKPIGMLMPTQPIDLSNSGRSSRFNPYPPLLRVRSGLLKQEPEVSSTASSPDESHLWHPLFGSQKRQQHQQQQQQQQYQQAQQQHVSWHRTTLAS